ncbi:ABC transporter ATP-binding protein [Leuconostoc carnosum]|uniref:ABC transporter ATP-binding protein n=1 Tax=Leuconostoc TaxID=1243 RepID=UPI000D50EE95|nr:MULTISPECIES: ABC transporter ATP-binding protein [Leuconostoc]KAA8324545.1 ABC transporter ATP-binding protein [Leuconostoc carnosum]KAA8358218.1 ABC transporter ATP-binding protein [Leuconostoc carnosum]KAA8364716.1 ABC transporter ATP-binding protein [Leuconostoc carnosum]KAA8365589.1 ABC transporter ATP-binding protein [Leuconostoc carnosum]KAA8371617.1 ABC transporter ATP-binding protein [Leuconostoc carnosum]
MSDILTVDSIVKQYGDFTAVKSISFKLQQGKSLAILGPNGAGKSTTLKMIYATTTPTSGRVTIRNIDVSDNPREAKRHIGVVMQDDLLDTSLNVIENMVAHAILFDMSWQSAQKKAETLLQFVGLSNYKKKEIHELSGGMRRRLVLARALVNDPELIILDEPTTGLDIQSRHVFWNRLEILQKQGVSILITSHYGDEIERLANDVLIIDHGQIIAQGVTSELPSTYGYQDIEAAYLGLTGYVEERDEIEQTVG